MTSHMNVGHLPVAAQVDATLLAMLAKRAMPSPYGALRDNSNDVRRGRVGFMPIESAPRCDEKVQVLFSLDGVGGPEAAAAPLDDALVAAMVQRQIRPIGVSPMDDTAAHAAGDGITLTAGGICDAELGHSTGTRTFTVPGDVMEAIVPLPTADGEYGLDNTDNAEARLQIVPQSGASVAADFVTHLYHMIDGSPGSAALWARVHSEAWRNASALHTALHNFSTAVLTYLAIGCPQLTDDAVRAVLVDNDAVEDLIENQPAVARALALGIIPDRDGLVEPGAASANLRLNVLNRLFYSGKNPFYEVGYDPATHNLRARCDEGESQPPDATSLGDLLSAQLNATTAAVSAMHDVTMERATRTIGRALTHTSNQVPSAPIFSMLVGPGRT